MLGCTHYPLLAGVLQIVLGPDVTLVSSAEETGKDVFRVLMTHDLAREPDDPPHAPHEFLATGDPEPFRRLGRRFLGPEIGAVAALDGIAAPGGRRPRCTNRFAPLGVRRRIRCAVRTDAAARRAPNAVAVRVARARALPSV